MDVAAALSALFSVLHDGEITSAKGTARQLTLRIDCPYLAELFRPAFYFFYVELTGISACSFASWETPDFTVTDIVAVLAIIVKGGFEIADAEVENGKAIIKLLNSSPKHSGLPQCIGGNLLIDCQSFSLFDQERRALTLETLQQTASSYWSQFCDGN
jgi:hypothetical protein